MIDVEQFDTVRRPEDAATIYGGLNRAQENVISGGPEGVRRQPMAQRRRTTVRPVNGINSNVSFNSALWNLSTKMAELKAKADNGRRRRRHQHQLLGSQDPNRRIAACACRMDMQDMAQRLDGRAYGNKSKVAKQVAGVVRVYAVD